MTYFGYNQVIWHHIPTAKDATEEMRVKLLIVRHDWPHCIFFFKQLFSATDTSDHVARKGKR